jgi:hypothetical protein
MSRPRQSWLVIASGQAQATFDDLADARGYAHEAHAGGDPHIVCLPHWPSGMWRYGVETLTSGRVDDDRAERLPPRVSTVAQAAHQEHMRTKRSCEGADLETLTSRHSLPRYRCQRCRDRIL